MTDLPRIAVFAGPNATILNTPPLVTDERALRPQRLAAPVTVYVEQFSAHPLEVDAADLYEPPDAWLDAEGEVHGSYIPGLTPVYRVELRPEDGLYLLPYVARQADGSPWEDVAARPGAGRAQCRQSFYPDAERLYAEIDRFGIGPDGRSGLLSHLASFDFFRAAPSGGWTKAHPPERDGDDFFAYYPTHLLTEPTTATLAVATNLVQRVLATGNYIGAQWLEGSPTIEETLYWLGLLIDTPAPIVGHAAQRPHLAVGADGDRNIVDGAEFIVSRIWADANDANRLGAVLVVDEMVLSAREVAKTDARPGNYKIVGGHGGVLASFGGDGPLHVTFLPVRHHTHTSSLNLSRLARSVGGAQLVDGRVRPVSVDVLDGDGQLVADAMPRVTIETYGRYQSQSAVPGPGEPGLDATIDDNLARFPLAGFIGEGSSPYGTMHPSTDRSFRRAVLSGMPVVKVGRGHPGGDAFRVEPLFISGNDLTATKARILLLAALLKLGAVPPAREPTQPTPPEVAAAAAHIARYQELFDTH